MRDGPPCLHCGLRHPRRAPCIPVLPAPDIPSEWPRIEAEREAHIRADERARIVAYLRGLHRKLPHLLSWLPRITDAIERQEHADDHP